jgi:hypothetical protein
MGRDLGRCVNILLSLVEGSRLIVLIAGVLENAENPGSASIRGHKRVREDENHVVTTNCQVKSGCTLRISQNVWFSSIPDYNSHFDLGVGELRTVTKEHSR